MNRVVRPLAVILGCCSLPFLACAKRPSTPTGLAVGLGASSTAVPAAVPYQPNPVEPLADKSSAKPDVVGTFSVENFQGTQNNLTYTHESADGFRDYLAKWYSPNYIYRDAGVGAWAFHDVAGGDNWDMWTGSSGTVDYGLDAVLVSFHSSHGGTNTTTKIYSACLGTNWSGRGWRATSDKMALGGDASSFGNERLRYMFWDTCQAVKWNDGVTPYQTWGARAKGIRMIFGYATNSVDSPNYGKYFWEEWNKNKSFKTAFLDASWRISHNQSPCVIAFGASTAEAANRRDTERTLDRASVSNTAGAWGWRDTAKVMGGGKVAPQQPIPIPGQISPRTLVPRGNSDGEVFEAAYNLGIDISDERLVENRPFDLRAVRTNDVELVVESDGDFELQFTSVASKVAAGGPVVDDDILVGQAQQIADQFNLTKGRESEASEISYLGANQISEDGKAGPDQILEKTVVLDQVVDGLPFIDPDAGHLEVTFDATTQEVRRIRSTWKQIDEVADKSAAAQKTKDPLEVREIAIRMATPPPEPDDLGGEVKQVELEILPDSEQIGFYMRDGQPLAVYRALLIDPRYPDSKLREVIVPLAVSE